VAADIMELEGNGVPSVLVVTQPFKSLAENALKFRKFQEVPVHVLPQPIETRPDEEVRSVADSHVPDILRQLQKP
jgi:hypothetical protein